jgi:hypothetical protein
MRDLPLSCGGGRGGRGVRAGPPPNSCHVKPPEPAPRKPMSLNLTNHKAIDTYYAALATYRSQDVTHEQATRLAFSTLLDAVSKTAGWTLALEQALAIGKRPNPNRADDEEYIVRLIGRVMTVSVETVKLVKLLLEVISELVS